MYVKPHEEGNFSKVVANETETMKTPYNKRLEQTRLLSRFLHTQEHAPA